MTDSNGPEERAPEPAEAGPGGSAGQPEAPTESRTPDTEGGSLHERMRRRRTGGAEEPPQEQPKPTGRQPRVARKEPGRRVRAQERAAAVREPTPAPPAREVKKPAQEVKTPAQEVEPVEPPAVRPDEGPPAEGDLDEQAEAVGQRLAGRLAALRAERGWSLQDLSQRTGISRSNLSRIERGEISPTTEALVKLAAAYDLSVSGLVAEVEAQPRSLVRAAEQAVTGEDAWRRRVVSPPYPGLVGSITDAQLLPGTDVTYEPPLTGAEHHLWLITGMLEITVAIGQPGPGPASSSGEDAEADPEIRAENEGDFVLVRGDCLRMRLWGPARLRCLSPDPARYALFTVTP
jgi:transcriptional regulator with XRE-family HTH domain